MESPDHRAVAINIDRRGFVYVDGIRVCRLIPSRGTLQFCDRNRQRSQRRGTRFVEVKLEDFFLISKTIEERQHP